MDLLTVKLHSLWLSDINFHKFVEKVDEIWSKTSEKLIFIENENRRLIFSSFD